MAELVTRSVTDLAAIGLDAAINLVTKRMMDYIEEHGNTDPETGTVEFPGNGEEYVGEWQEIIEALEEERQRVFNAAMATVPHVYDVHEVDRERTVLGPVHGLFSTLDAALAYAQTCYTEEYQRILLVRKVAVRNVWPNFADNSVLEMHYYAIGKSEIVKMEMGDFLTKLPQVESLDQLV